VLDPTELFPEVPNLYEFPSIHADMLFDEERVGKYAEAINRCVKKGDIVADIGTGTGLLAFLCLQAGAKRVHAIERSAAIEWAKALADKNGFSDRIVFHKEDSRRLELNEKVDVVVSELIGHIAFEEGMAESLFDAKKRFLSSNGSIIPQNVGLHAALVNEKEIYADCIDCWQPIRGIDYSLLREEAVKSCYIAHVNDRDLMSEPITLASVNFRTDQMPRLRGTHTFKVIRKGHINGLVLWFDAILALGVRLSSGPWSRTHWKQCFAPIQNPMQVETNEYVQANIEMRLRTKSNDNFEFRMNLAKGD
jgi:SAM-dependent methyltransferase